MLISLYIWLEYSDIIIKWNISYSIFYGAAYFFILLDLKFLNYDLSEYV